MIKDTERKVEKQGRGVGWGGGGGGNRDQEGLMWKLHARRSERYSFCDGANSIGRADTSPLKTCAVLSSR